TTMQPLARKDSNQPGCKTLITMRNGTTAPATTKTDPRINNLRGDVILLVEPALDEVAGARLKRRRLFYIAEPFNEAVAPGMEPASGRRIDQAGRLSRRHLFETMDVVRIGVGNGVEQHLGVGVKRVFD